MKIVVGIDPDIDKSGVAVLHPNKMVELSNLRFFQLYDFLNHQKENIKEVVVEASWLIKHNWNKKVNGSAAINAAIGSSAGANHETGRKIVEMCEYLNIPCVQKRPLRKIWKGPDGKITHEEFTKIIKHPIKRTNQEQRDACLLII